MKKLLYIEHKSEQADRGPAWIGLAALSKSGRTVYFNGRALKRADVGSSGNHYCLETGDAFWVSGPKRSGGDRHWAGGGIVLVQQQALAEYLTLRDITSLNPKHHRVSHDIQPTDISKFTELDNHPLNPNLDGE